MDSSSNASPSSSLAAACGRKSPWVLGRDEKLVSHHLRLLKIAGLARSRPAGKLVMYEPTGRARALLDALAGDAAIKA